MSQFVKVAGHLVNVQAIASAHWEKTKLFVHLVGGRFLSFTGADAVSAWAVLERHVSTEDDQVEVGALEVGSV
jgi:hypothetical protein